MVQPDLRTAAAELRQAALSAVDPGAAIRRHVCRKGDMLIVADRHYDMSEYERIFVIGGGKAAISMAGAITDILGKRMTKGVAVTKYEHTGDWSARRFEVIEAGHPVPDENSVRGARAVADLASQASERDLIICLISGGGSALLTLPAEGLTLADLQALTGDLLRCGATINEINTVRKHCSRIKGGNLARLAAPAQLIALILSDVIGDPLDVIASGPTVPDPTSLANAREILSRYGVAEPVCLQESPKAGDAIFEKVQNVIVGSNRLAALAAIEKARELGFNTLLLGTYLEGEAREVAKAASALAKSIRACGDPIAPPACIVWGGETTVTIGGKGKGGRNQELALAAALALDGWDDILVMPLATDGTDGPTDAAGAIVTGESIARANEQGLDAWAALNDNDSYHFFDALDGPPGLIRTGPTGTNVNDLLFVLVGAG